MKGVTPYQLEILQHLTALQAKTGQLADFDQLLERLSWKPTKASAQFTIRALIGKGLVEKAPLQSRRGRNRVCYSLTEDGKLALDPRRPEPIKSSAEAELFNPELDDDMVELNEFLES